MKKILLLFSIFVISCTRTGKTIAYNKYDGVIEACDTMIENVFKEAVEMHATYYGNTYKGRRYTASGEVFDKHAMTCAAPAKYGFGTKLRITNPRNGKSVIVRVNDRGHNNLNGKIIDLSYAAFGEICEHRMGRIQVIVEEFIR